MDSMTPEEINDAYDKLIVNLKDLERRVDSMG